MTTQTNNPIAQKNKASWNAGAARYSHAAHSENMMNRLLENPQSVFHHTTWEVIHSLLPDLAGKRICVPSSGDNMAVFAFAMMGAKVTSCDISENQLANAERIAKKFDWGKSIEFICTDTMRLDGVADDTYDFVYTSNGVHVWINDLLSMYRNIHRVMKPGGAYVMFEIHPMQRPIDFNEKSLDGKLTVIKPYDNTGPFDDGEEVTFAWRIMDIMNAMLSSGLAISHIEEMFAEVDYDEPFFVPFSSIVNGQTLPSREEIEAMHDWHNNPVAALPNWLCVAARK